MRKVIERGSGMREELESIEEYRRSMSVKEQADFLRRSYLALSEDDRAPYFSLYYQAYQRRRKRKT